MGVKLCPKTKLVEITKDAVIVDTELGRESIPEYTHYCCGFSIC